VEISGSHSDSGNPAGPIGPASPGPRADHEPEANARECRRDCTDLRSAFAGAVEDDRDLRRAIAEIRRAVNRRDLENLERPEIVTDAPAALPITTTGTDARKAYAVAPLGAPSPPADPIPPPDIQPHIDNYYHVTNYGTLLDVLA